MNLMTLLALAAIAELGLHYFPWKLLLRGRELPRVAAYTLGVLGLMAPFSVWLFEHGEVEVLRTMWMVIAAGGVMVFALYGLDHYIDVEWQSMEAMERDQHAKS